MTNKEKPDILCLNETKIDETTITKENINKLYSETYQSYWNCSKEKSGYSGTAIFTKYKPLSVKYDIDNEYHDKEGRVITLEYDNFYLVSVYVPNAGEGLKRLNYRVKEWDKAFFEFLNKLKQKKDIIICGDLNVAHKEIDIFDPKSKKKSAGFTNEERESFSKFLEFGYVDTFRTLYPDVVKYSYFSTRAVRKSFEDNKGWRLDYFITNCNLMNKIVDSDILIEYEGSDHCPIKLVVKL